MILCKLLHSCTTFSTNINNELIIIDESSTFKYYNNLELMFEKDLPGSLYQLNLNSESVFFYNDLLETAFGTWGNTKYLHLIQIPYTIILIQDAYIYLEKNKQTIKSSLNDGTEIWHINERLFNHKFHDKNIFNVAEKLKIHNIDSFSGTTVWSFTLPLSSYNWSEINHKNELVYRQSEIKRIVGVFNEVVWIVLNNGRLLGLDINDGNLKYDVTELNKYIGGKPLFYHYPVEIQNRMNWALYFLQYTQLDEKKGVIFGLKNFYYFEIDLKDPLNSFTIFDASDSFLEHKIEADMAHGYEWTWQENEIFFGHNFSENNNLGIFNRETKTVTWSTRLKQENGQARNLAKIEYGSDTLYVLDQLKTLHIFKRDSTFN